MASIYLSLLAISMVLIVVAHCDPVDDLSCANHVHRECSQCSFDHNQKWDKDWCKKLKQCGDCLAVPRCQSSYLERFVQLAVTTMKMAKQTKICPDINYNKLLQYADGKAKCPDGENSVVYDQCGQQCTCVQGHFYSCRRIRKEFTKMPYNERRRFVDVYYKATTDPYYRDAFNELLMKHSRIPTNLLHHMPQIFLPWHRWFSLKIENFLRQIDCRVTLPYYQWTARVDDGTVWRSTDPSDVWYGGPQGIGGNGVSPSMCVKDGKFREHNWHIATVKGGGCLKRNFNYKCKFYNQERLDKLFKGSFEHFEHEVREELHAKFHDCVGGLMPDNRYSSCAPEFILHHAFMDKLWHSFQKRSLKKKYSFYGSVNFKMPFADMYGFELFDSYNLPGEVAVEYEEFNPDKKSRQDPESDDYADVEDRSRADEEFESKYDSQEDIIDPEFEVEFKK